MSAARRLVVNADDFGFSPAINRGVLRAHTDGIVTSASVMVRHPAAADGVAVARAHAGLALGLHLDLGEWEYRDGRWRAIYRVVVTDDSEDIERELRRQLAEFRRLTGSDPTHIDSHQHVHRSEPVRSAARRAAAVLGVPVRHAPGVRYCGDFYGQDRNGASLPELVSTDALVTLVGTLEPGVTELACHPADGVDFESSYGVERVAELSALCDPRVRDALREHDVELCSFRDLAA